MKLTKFFQKSSLIALASVLYIADANANSWERHIYNDTGKSWTFLIDSRTGNFYANCVSNCAHGTDTYKNQNFTVSGDETWQIKMTTTNGAHKTDVTIINPFDSTITGEYCFTTDNSSSIYADHIGNTGGVILNNPANADVQLYSSADLQGSSPCH